jgi:hypothetical protein
MDIDTAVVLNDTAAALLPPRANLTDTGMVVYHVGINLRNQVEGNATLPNQMRYIPADCRIYWTFSNYANYTRLWHDVHTAAYIDSSLCVAGSTNATASPLQKRTANPQEDTETDSSDRVALSSYIIDGLSLTDIPIGAGVPADKGLTAANFPVLCVGKDGKADQKQCANGILKISHYLNLSLHEGMPFGRDLVVRGSLERLTPVLMTALSAGVALVPLLIDAATPGKEILHPVAVTIFGGLISATLLDTVLTPVLFLRFGKAPLERLRAAQAEATDTPRPDGAKPRPVEAF